MGGPHTDDELDSLLAGGRLGAETKDRIEAALVLGAARPTARRRWVLGAGVAAVLAAGALAAILLARRRAPAGETPPPETSAASSAAASDTAGAPVTVAVAPPASVGAGAANVADVADIANIERPAGFVDIADVAPGIVVSMRYAGSSNFLGRAVRGYAAPRCLLAAPAARALAEVANDLAAAQLALMVYDCYRPRRAVADFVAWGRDLDDTTTQAVHYPAVPKSELFKRGYIAFHSGHSRGSTVDLTLVPLAATKRTPNGSDAEADCRTIAGPFAADGSLDMGTFFDCFDERSHTASPRIAPPARHNRALLRAAMEKRGFTNYANEWWHYTLANEPFPDTSFDFEVRGSKLH